MVIKGTTLIMTRGDTEYITVEMFDEEQAPLNFGPGDSIWFTVKYDFYDTINRIQKTTSEFTDNKAVIKIDPSDTKDLPFKKYVYDIQLTRANGEISTIIPSPGETAYFVLGGEVTND